MTGIVVPENLPPGRPTDGVEDIYTQVYGWLDCLRSSHRAEARVAAFKARFAAELAGSIVFEKAWVLVDCLDGIAPQVAWAVEDLVLPTAAERTPAELRHAIERALVELDPEAADSRHAEAREKRFVSRPEVRADGMAQMSVFLPADQAVALDCALDSVAAAALAEGDERTCTQLRADALGEWARRTLERGWRFTTTEGAEVRSAPTRVNVTVPLEVLARAVPGWQCPT